MDGALLEARVLPMTTPAAEAEAVGWRNGRIERVGTSQEVEAWATEHGVPVQRLAGRLVLPGFVDAHTHLLHQGMRGIRPSLAGLGSRSEALEAIARWMEANPGPGPVMAEEWDESHWSDPRYPTRQELDAIAPDRPLAARRVCGHVAVVNTAALERVARIWSSPDVDADTGLLLEGPSLYLNEALPASAEEMDAALERACRLAHRLGVTTVGDYAQAPNRAALQRAAALGRLSVRVHCSIYVQQLDAELRRGFCTGRPAIGPQDPDAAPERWQPAVVPRHDATGEGNGATAAAEGHGAPVPPADGGSSPWLWDGGLKVFLDGSLGGHTALLREPYADQGGHGLRNWTDEQVRAFFTQAAENGVQIHAHAIGDGAIAQALDAFQALLSAAGLGVHGPPGRGPTPPAAVPDPHGETSSDNTSPAQAPEREILDTYGTTAGRQLRNDASPDPLRHRIEHFELAPDDLLETTARLGVVASCQPNFVGEWSGPGGMYEERLGDRYRSNNRYQTIRGHGIELAFGSDGMPFGPLYGIACASRHPDPGERLDARTAIWHYTDRAAWSLHRSDVGHLAPGAWADLVILDQTTLDGDPATWRIQETVVAGVPRLGSLRVTDGEA